MKVKNVKLNIQDEDAFINGIKQDMEKAVNGKEINRESVISFESIATMKKFITDERVRVIKAIKAHKPASIYELAKLLHRDAKNVSNDVHYLSDLGLVDIEKQDKGRAKTKPVVDYDKIVLEIAI